MFDINNLDKIIENSKFKAKIKYFLNKHNLNIVDLKKLIFSLKIYLDYDEVLVNLNEEWIKYYNLKNNTNYSIDDIDKFYWWDDKDNGLDFLLKNNDCYKNVSIKKDVNKFFDIAKNNNILNNMRIVTFSYPNNLLSKYNHIKKNFPWFDEKDIHITGQKWELDFNHSIIIEDSASHSVKIVRKNPFAYVLLLNMKYNEDLVVGNRIKRINSILELFDYLPLLALENYNRHNDIKKKYLYKEILDNRIN